MTAEQEDHGIDTTQFFQPELLKGQFWANKTTEDIANLLWKIRGEGFNLGQMQGRASMAAEVAQVRQEAERYKKALEELVTELNVASPKEETNRMNYTTELNWAYERAKEALKEKHL